MPMSIFSPIHWLIALIPHFVASQMVSKKPGVFSNADWRTLVPGESTLIRKPPTVTASTTKLSTKNGFRCTTPP